MARIAGVGKRGRWIGNGGKIVMAAVLVDAPRKKDQPTCHENFPIAPAPIGGETDQDALPPANPHFVGCIFLRRPITEDIYQLLFVGETLQRCRHRLFPRC